MRQHDSVEKIGKRNNRSVQWPPKAEALAGQQEAARRKRELERTRAALERQIVALRSEHEAGAEELRRIDEQVGTQTLLLTTERTELGRLRQADVSVAASAPGKAKQRRKNG